MSVTLLLFRYFQETWCLAIFHDRFADFRDEVRELLITSPVSVIQYKSLRYGNNGYLIGQKSATILSHCKHETLNYHLQVSIRVNICCFYVSPLLACHHSQHYLQLVLYLFIFDSFIIITLHAFCIWILFRCNMSYFLSNLVLNFMIFKVMAIAASIYTSTTVIYTSVYIYMLCSHPWRSIYTIILYITCHDIFST